MKLRITEAFSVNVFVARMLVTAPGPALTIMLVRSGLHNVTDSTWDVHAYLCHDNGGC